MQLLDFWLALWSAFGAKAPSSLVVPVRQKAIGLDCDSSAILVLFAENRGKLSPKHLTEDLNVRRFQPRLIRSADVVRASTSTETALHAVSMIH